MLFDAVADATSGASASVQQQGQSAQKRLAGMRLLVVEDNLMNQQVAQELLSYEGAYVDVANNGRQAISRILAAGQPFDAVLMDIQMPDIDGYEATRILREEKGFRTLPIIAMTANALPEDRQACLAAGMDDHIGKPFDIRQVVSVLLRHCRPPSAGVTTAAGAQYRPGEDVALPAMPAGFSLSDPLARLGHNRGLLVDLLRQFCRDQRHAADEIAALLQRGDRQSALHLLHTLKGLAGAVGAQSLAQHALSMEERLRAGTDVAENEELLARLREVLGESIRVLSQSAEDLAATTPALAAPIGDPARALELLARLAVLLEENNMHAMDVFATLKQELGGVLREHLAALDESMARLDFATALDRCRNLRTLLKS